MSQIPKLRTAEQAFEEIRRRDPETALTKHAVRTLMASGDVPVVKVGKKTLVEMDVLIAHLYHAGKGEEQ